MYSTSIAYLLWLFSGFGVLGFHRFYLGRFGTGLLYLFTGGLFGLGALFDLFYIPTMVREANLQMHYRDAMFGNYNSQRQSYNTASDSGIGSFFQSRTKESIERVILKTAKRNGGIVSPGEVALQSNVTIEDAKSYLEKLVKQGYAEMRVKKVGMLVYVFPEFLTEERKSELEDF